ncbi:uncharacterized protein LOC119319088 [Triticum dicoccoides]|uniref:uncharacterized protein LOC119319088 n=1 Tax=Triticum dicoccoides TaxID=85692 RepID=UPI001891835B|nr:uncharacterized protein LOC119319088 [Triticum dicoccoides]
MIHRPDPPRAILFSFRSSFPSSHPSPVFSVTSPWPPDAQAATGNRSFGLRSSPPTGAPMGSRWTSTRTSPSTSLPWNRSSAVCPLLAGVPCSASPPSHASRPGCPNKLAGVLAPSATSRTRAHASRPPLHRPSSPGVVGCSRQVPPQRPCSFVVARAIPGEQATSSATAVLIHVLESTSEDLAASLPKDHPVRLR